jgi:NAD(P)H-quinone oxidoreductase subunit 5
MRRLVTVLVGVQSLAALMVAIARALSGVPVSVSLVGWSGEFLIQFVYGDGAASLMLLLVSFVGFIVSRYSIRYLDAEAGQGRYFRWLGFTIGAVSLMVIAGNLLLLFAAWVMTSFGLHHLLLHYRQRQGARRAAWTKFAISRLGDAFLIAALVLTYQTFGTFDLPELFAKARDVAAGWLVTTNHAAIGWLLVLGAITKSAQFPFHTWLPDTLETPTPVSALMHAGIVNAGGYLVIRMSPLVGLAPTALVTLAVIGAFTACFAGVVMMAQPSIKRTLAYSTVAQMGFMMFQCGLGAFSVAMLHILAHSLYKAHAFLSSGSVVSQSSTTSGAKSPTPTGPANIAFLTVAVAAAVFAYVATASIFGIDTSAKHGGLILAFILCLALTTWGWKLLTLAQWQSALVAFAGLAALCGIYVASYLAVDQLLALPDPIANVSPLLPFVLIVIALAFGLLFALHAVVIRPHQPGWLQRLRIHAMNGFYVDAIYHRLFPSLSKS